MTYTELTILTNRRIDEIAMYIKRGNTLNYDPQLARVFNEFFSQNVRNMTTSMQQKLLRNLSLFSDAKTQMVINEMLSSRSSIDDILTGFKSKINNFSDVEAGIVKGKVRQVEQFDLWTKKGGYLKYTTASDEKVRESHQRLEGLIRPVNDTIWQSIAPRVAYNCRCTLKHILKPDYISDIPSIEGVADNGISGNAFFSGEIFTKNHSYFQ